MSQIPHLLEQLYEQTKERARRRGKRLSRFRFQDYDFGGGVRKAMSGRTPRPSVGWTGLNRLLEGLEEDDYLSQAEARIWRQHLRIAKNEISPEPFDLLAILKARTLEQLEAAIATQPYDHRTTGRVRYLLQDYAECDRIYALTAELAIERLEDDPPQAATLGAIMSTGYLDRWHPSEALKEKIRKRILSELNNSGPARIGAIEGLAFALSALGEKDGHVAYLRTIVNDGVWNKADSLRIRAYYGSLDGAFDAIPRHYRERRGLLFANDLRSLLEIIRSPEMPKARRPQARYYLEAALTEAWKVGEDRLVRDVIEKVRHLRSVS